MLLIESPSNQIYVVLCSVRSHKREVYTRAWDAQQFLGERNCQCMQVESDRAVRVGRGKGGACAICCRGGGITAIG